MQVLANQVLTGGGGTPIFVRANTGLTRRVARRKKRQWNNHYRAGSAPHQKRFGPASGAASVADMWRSRPDGRSGHWRACLMSHSAL